jgi:hypothetical protein
LYQTLNVSKDEREREAAIKRFFETKMAQLVTKVRLAQ